MRLDDFKATIDFVFACAVVHEMPAPGPIFNEAADALKPGGTFLLAEPAGHVDEAEFADELAAAAQAGLALLNQPSIRSFRTALFRKPAT
jgi:SAM-dependent methyltransferase